MGIFPIIMNIMQFWLIDSIVKASAHPASVALPSDSARNSLDADQEPLFRASMDDEDEDPRPHDVENPPSPPRSRSVSRDRLPLILEEPKSSNASSATASASGSVTPKVIDMGSNSVAMHAYPPSLASTSTSPRSSRSPPSRGASRSPQLKIYRRSPPPRLSLHPRPPQPFAFGSHEGSPLPQQPPRNHPRDLADDHDEKWAAWDDADADDWARGGEGEDWAEQGIDTRKTGLQTGLQNIWTDHQRENPVRISSG